VLLTLLLVLCEDRGSGSEKQEQNCYADKVSLFHFIVFLLSAMDPLTLQSFSIMPVGYDCFGDCPKKHLSCQLLLGDRDLNDDLPNTHRGHPRPDILLGCTRAFET
jgi:hypothetical protein